jgi:acyl-coenzyme A synthetase/AMP-(fatty) acid ligase
MILPSPLASIEAQIRILQQKDCKIYVRPPTMSAFVDKILINAKEIISIDGPELNDLLVDGEISSRSYGKSWNEGKDDPWLVYHTSGTTGIAKPQPITEKSNSD